MEIFKKALKQAILEKAEAVRFEAGQAPALVSYSQDKDLTTLGKLEHQTLFELTDAILPPNPSSPSIVREGSISIVNFGEVKLLASVVEPLRLFAFIPPQGTLPYLQMKTQLTQQAQKVPPRILEEVEDKAGSRPDFSLSQPPQYKKLGSNVESVESADEPSGDGAVLVPTLAEPSHVAQVAETSSELSPLPADPGLDEGSLEFKTVYMKAGNAGLSSEDPLLTVATANRPSEIPLPLETPSKAFDSPTTLYVPTPPPSAASDTLTAAPNFSKAEVTQTDDYHFHPSARQMNPRTEVAFPNSLDQGRGHPMMDTTITPPRRESTIVFGPHLPGEVLSDSGPKPIDALLETMVKQRASDLHLTMNEPPCVRVDGEILRIAQERLTEEQMRSYLLPIMPQRNREEFASAHDTDFAYELPGMARFRVNMFRDRMGVGAVLRQIPDRILSADELGLSPAIRKLCELQKGLVIVTGPTGSGKSTTLASMIDLINESRSDHILTIEDPIEFVHPQKRCLINQREVHRHTQSFSRALRAALREDPDIILIGELRDLETVEIAIETAETGHLVFGTLHTNTAISTIDRLIDQFSADQQEQIRVMLAESLKGVVAQTLVKKKGGGRVAAQEVLIVDRAVSALIREGNTHMVHNQMQTQKAKGNVLLNDALLNLVTKGLIEAKDAYLKAVDKEGFLALLQQKGINLEGLKSVS